MKKIINVIEYILVTILVIIITSVATLFLLGYRARIVVSASMEPTIKTGALLYYKKIDTKDVYDNIDYNSIIVYRSNAKEVVTHKVAMIDIENDTIITKSIKPGASNDAPINSSQVMGVYAFSIPVLGFIVDYIGSIYFIIIVLIVSILIFLGYILLKAVKEEKKKK